MVSTKGFHVKVPVGLVSDARDMPAPAAAHSTSLGVICGALYRREAAALDNLETHQVVARTLRTLVTRRTGSAFHAISTVWTLWSRRTRAADVARIALDTLETLDADSSPGTAAARKSRAALETQTTLDTCRANWALQAALAFLPCGALWTNRTLCALVTGATTEASRSLGTHRTTLPNVNDDGLRVRHAVRVDNFLQVAHVSLFLLHRRGDLLELGR
mmetsp:Transcript_84358/g.123395  ORF Transcript_84358/g.123395 Transcript_84358/m.123395 type:complete len:218 (+) Transcript_84358:520-1173(+)